MIFFSRLLNIPDKGLKDKLGQACGVAQQILKVNSGYVCTFEQH
jgi:hypothetical protein